jgi:predicted ArsR family transcriptional regulator
LNREDLDARLDQVAALGEPVRRALYRFVISQTEPVTREQAADGVGVPGHTAKFHLDRLVEAHLLEAGYRRPPGRSGPGAGRPAKVYRRRGTDLDVSVPERRYDLAGALLVRAVAEAARTGVPAAASLRRVANDAGRAAGAEAATPSGGQRGPGEALTALVGALVRDGYEPRRQRSGITLANCPFHALACEEMELVCGMNLAYLEGLLDGLGAVRLRAVLDPADQGCCVRFVRR